MTIWISSDHPEVNHASQRGKVDGSSRFFDDVPTSSSLYAAFAYSSETHAEVVAIDTSRAAQVPGVVAVITGEDTRGWRFGRSTRDYPVLAEDRVLFAGQRVAAVAAIDAVTAQRAAELIDVEYRGLTPLHSASDALAPDALPLHPDYENYIGAHPRRSHPNIQGEEVAIKGEPEDIFAKAEHIYDHLYSWGRVHSAPLEPHGCIVVSGVAGIHVFSSHKEPYSLRRDIAEFAKRPESDVIVHHISIGGDFGAKGVPYVEGACYLLSHLTGRPVRTALNYFDELTTTGARHPGWMRLRSVVDSDGFLGHELEAVYDGGAFAGLKPQPRTVLASLGIPAGAYGPLHSYERVRCVYTNNLPGAQVRSPGEFQATFAGESHIDMIARSRCADPLMFRLECARVPEAVRVLESLRGTVAAWRDDPSSDTGIGVAVFHRGSGTGKTRVKLDALTDELVLAVGAADQGAGSFAVFRSLVAAHLSVPTDRVRVVARGADGELVDSGAGGSRVTRIAGSACLAAARALASRVGPPPPGGRRWWVGSRLEALGEARISVTGTHEVSRVRKSPAPPTYGAMALKVHIDRKTGVPRIRAAALVVDAGVVVNPSGHRGQLEGAFIYGIGQALYENLVVEDGRVMSASLGDYKIPSASDIPPLEIELLPPENEDISSDNIRPVGELTNLGVAPAIANAIDDAVGVRVTSLPILAEDIYAQLQR